MRYMLILAKNRTNFDPPMKKFHNQMDTSIHTAYSTFFVHCIVCSFSFLSFSSQISNFCKKSFEFFNYQLKVKISFSYPTLENDFRSFIIGNLLHRFTDLQMTIFFFQPINPVVVQGFVYIITKSIQFKLHETRFLQNSKLAMYDLY